jgi:hypothetical protein
MLVPEDLKMGLSVDSLIEAAMLDDMRVLSRAAIGDYGVTNENFIFYQMAIRGGLTAEQLHERNGDGASLSMLLSREVGELVTIKTIFDNY